MLSDVGGLSFDPVPYYCEENVWMFFRSRSGADGSFAVLVSNENRTVRFSNQRNRAASETMVWDYHVVALVSGNVVGGPDPQGEWFVRDFNCALGDCLTAGEWIARSFPARDGWNTRDDPLSPRFKLVSADVYLSGLSSDRAHMRDARGTYAEPPPPWPRIGRGRSNLERFIDVNDGAFGPVVTLGEFASRFARSPHG